MPIDTPPSRASSHNNLRQSEKPPQPANHGLWRFFYRHWKSAKILLYSAKVLDPSLS
jgi:hypothetical protein